MDYEESEKDFHKTCDGNQYDGQAKMKPCPFVYDTVHVLPNGLNLY